MASLVSSARRAALAPFWAAQLLTGAKSFMDNPIIGSRALNERGLHAGRVSLAYRMAERRRGRLARLISPADRAAFDRDGFVARPGFLPQAQFDALLAEVKGYRGEVREQVQGDAVTRRIALSPSVLARIPAARAVLGNPDWRGLIRYAGSYDSEPLAYIQTILSHSASGADDPQCEVHADTFHPTVKAWLFLTDVAEDEGPFTYVPGSHRLTPERLAWEKRMSVEMSEAMGRLTRRGSFRARPADLEAMRLPPPRTLPVAANTLVVADTFGFHARGPSVRPTVRVEIWAYGRRNPFLPFTGLDPWRLDALGQRRVPLFWQSGDVAERLGLGRNTWQARPDGSAFDGR